MLVTELVVLSVVTTIEVVATVVAIVGVLLLGEEKLIQVGCVGL